ncbi:MAG: phage tail protein [Paludibacteraceae bacterium]|jgi:phage tail-like protein|nr:phage tail protein [Paludibacteraceae bacterium]
MSHKADRYVPAFHFEVTFLSVALGLGGLLENAINGDDNIGMAFSEVSGLSAELQTEDVAEGGNNSYKYRLPKPPKYGNLVLKRALSTTPSLLVMWANEAIYNFNFSPCTAIVTLLNENHLPVKVWAFNNAYPVKIEVSQLGANKNELVIETLELAYNYSKRIF